MGYSKWYDNNGNFEWKYCKVLDYDSKQERFNVEWVHNKK